MDRGGNRAFDADSGSTRFGRPDGTEAMRIDASGNLLVGKTGTNTLATVGHDFGVSGYAMHSRDSSTVFYLNRNTSDGAIQEFYKDGTNVGSIGVVTSDNLYIQGNSSHNGLAFGSNALIPFKNSAYTDNVCDIGGSSNRFKDLYLSGVANVGKVVSGSVTTSDSAWTSTSNSSLSSKHMVFANTNGNVGDIRTNGTATAYITSSDGRLKENISDADDAGSKIDSIKVRKFDWISDGSHQDYGMIAQELIQVAPEAVPQPEDSEEMMGVDYSKLVPMLIKEIQSLRNRVASLEE